MRKLVSYRNGKNYLKVELCNFDYVYELSYVIFNFFFFFEML